MLDPLVRTVKKKGCGHVHPCWGLCLHKRSTSSYRRRFRTGENREKLAHMFRLLGVIRSSNDERITQDKLVFRSVTVWEPGTVGQDVETRSSRSHFPHDEMDTVPNSQVRQRTVMASGALSAAEGGAFLLHWSRLWLWAATPHGDRESHRLRPWTSSTRHGDSDPHEKLSQFVSHCSSGGEAAGRRT